VSGNKFITADGKTIVFQGLDTSDPDKLSRENHWNKEYFEAMKSWGLISFASLFIPMHGAHKERTIT
jgi:hypothetical protein